MAFIEDSYGYQWKNLMFSNLRLLLERCETQRKQVLLTVADLNCSQLTYLPNGGAWSLLEELHHLVLVEQETVLLASHPEDVIRLSCEFKRQRRAVPFVVVWLIMRCGIRVPVPTTRVLPTRDQSLSVLITQWDQARSQLISLMEAVEDQHLPFAVHPTCGPLRAEQVLRFLLVHTDYHARRIHRLCNSRKLPK